MAIWGSHLISCQVVYLLVFELSILLLLLSSLEGIVIFNAVLKLVLGRIIHDTEYRIMPFFKYGTMMLPHDH
jgi:hypothetical protein